MPYVNTDISNSNSVLKRLCLTSSISSVSHFFHRNPASQGHKR